MQDGGYRIMWSTLKASITIPENLNVSQASPVIEEDYIASYMSGEN